MAFDIFVSEKVDVAIFETGIGGEYDATNIIPAPAVTGITSLGLDHLRTLRVPPLDRPSYLTSIIGDHFGDEATPEEIAWHKGGIFKKDIPAFSVPQGDAFAVVLKRRAQDKGTSLKFVQPQDHHMPFTKVQTLNASLAIQLATTVLKKLENTPNHLSVIKVLERAQWPGRCHLIERGSERWLLDGAHTPESLNVCAEWSSTVFQRLGS